MILIKYKLDKSGRHGIGLFADENLKKGQLVYIESPILDVNISEEKFNSLTESEKQEVRYWGFWTAENRTWHVDFDVSRFINHSYEPTVTQDPSYKNAYLVTTRDIAEGEEITQNYLEFESKEDLTRRGIPPHQ